MNYADLPREKMRKLNVAFDVDGTLRCNCTDSCRAANEEIVTLMEILSKFKNIELWVWSGGGAEYAKQFARLYELPVKESHCISKFGAPRMDACIDDIQDTNLATLNLIVRQKRRNGAGKLRGMADGFTNQVHGDTE